jgi:dihydroflavonol-4-reductase
MRKLYLITGGTGHLGQNVIRLLQKNQNIKIRVLALPGDHTPLPEGIERVNGNVCDADSLLPFFDTDGYDEAVLFHLAAYITIASKANPEVWRVNVEGTRNIMNLALYKKINRVVYVSSVHAIPEQPIPGTITETAQFSPDSVHGQYAKSKAMAADMVLAFARKGLNVSIVHPSGIIGPGDTQRSNHMTRTIEAMATGRIPVSIGGGYDFVDVRDVAKGIIQCEEKGRAGECYILSGHFTTVSGLMKLISGYTGRKFLPLHIPGFVIKAAAVLGEFFSVALRRKPLFTPYSVSTLRSNALFSHRKATSALGYRTRSLQRTVRNLLRSLGYKEKIKSTI